MLTIRITNSQSSATIASCW